MSMGVYIKGMEMPKSCEECPLSMVVESGMEYGYGCQYTLTTGNPKMREKDCTARPTWCPLIELPPHGRLIDADALQKDGWKLRKEKMIMGGYSIQEMPLSYPLIPTIIEAEVIP